MVIALSGCGALAQPPAPPQNTPPAPTATAARSLPVASASTPNPQLSSAEKVLALIQTGVAENQLTLRATDQGKLLDSQLPRRLGEGASARTGPVRVRTGKTSVIGRLPPEVIQRVMRKNFGRVRACYETGLKSNPNLQGRVTVRFVIGRDGTVSNVSGSGDLPDSSVISCVTRALYFFKFPQPEGGIVTVTRPIVFSPGG